jgi:hypothetical protein
MYIYFKSLDLESVTASRNDSQYHSKLDHKSRMADSRGTPELAVQLPDWHCSYLLQMPIDSDDTELHQGPKIDFHLLRYLLLKVSHHLGSHIHHLSAAEHQIPCQGSQAAAECQTQDQKK